MLKGTTVVLDPGHNGANASHPVEVNRPVPNGRGGTKACDTTGTSTDGGYSEHAFNWDVARRVHDALTAHGVCVVLTRPDDAEVGPCVNDRAAIANRAAATAIISIHADGAAPSGHGFHVSYSDPPLNDSQGQPSVALAQTLAKARYRQRLWSDVRRRAGQLRLKLAVSVGTTLGSLPRSHHRDAPGRKADRLVSR
jgi:N-acetylmuramoyl-L-alanine amidase